MQLYHAGFGNEQLSLNNKSKATQCILHHQVIRSRQDAIIGLKNGLDTANFLDLLTANSGCLQLIFPLSHEVQYSANDIMALIDKTSLTGISDKQRKVFEWFTCYLTVLEEGIMHFISSAIVHRFPLGYSFNNVDGNEQIIIMVQKPTLLSAVLLDTTPKVVILAESGRWYLSVWCQLVK